MLLPLNPAAGPSKRVDFSGILQTVCLLRPRPENPHGLIAAADLTGEFRIIDLQSFTQIAAFTINSIVQRGSPVKVAETSRGLLLVASNRGSGLVDLTGILQSPTWPETGFHLEKGGSYAMFYGITAGAVRRNLNSATETHRIQHNLPVRAAISLPESGTVIVNTLMNELFAYSLGSQNSRRLISNQRMHLVQLEPLEGTSCLTLSPTGHLSVLSTKSMSELRSVDDSLLNEPGASPVFSDDGTLLAAPLLPESTTETYALTQPDTVTPSAAQKGAISHRRPHTSITASHENNLLYLAERGRSNQEHRTFVLPFLIRKSQPLTSSKLLLVSTSGEARLFDSTTEDLVTLGTDNFATTDFDLHIGSDTTKMVLTSDRGSVILHDTASETTTQLQLRVPAIRISFSPDGTSAVCADRTGTIHLLSCESLTLKHMSQIVLPIQTEIASIEHSPDGNTVLLTCGDEVENVQTLDAKTLSHIATTTLTKPGKAVWISNEEVVATSDFGFYRWQIKGSRESLTEVRTAAVRSITSSGPRLAWVEKESLPYAVASNSALSPQPLRHTETFSAYSMDTSTRIIAKHQTSTLPMSVHFDHAGQTLQVSGYTYSFRICRTNDMTQVESPKTRHAAPTILMRFLPDSHTLFLVFGDGSCCTWTPEDGGKTKNNAPTTSLIYAAVSSQRTHLLTVDSRNQGRVYQLPNCIEIPIPRLKKNVTLLAISSDNQKLYSLFTNGELRQTRIAPELVDPESTLIATSVVSAQPFPENPRLLLISRSTNAGGPVSLALLDTDSGTETAIGYSLNPVKASLAASGDQILLLTDDQRLLKLTLQESGGKWIVPDDSVAELATEVLHFNCPADSPFAVIFTQDATKFLSLQESHSDFVVPFSGTLANESTAKWDKASSSHNGLWFAVIGKKLECWPAELQHYVESNAGRQLTVAERKRYAIRDDLKN